MNQSLQDSQCDGWGQKVGQNHRLVGCTTGPRHNAQGNEWISVLFAICLLSATGSCIVFIRKRTWPQYVTDPFKGLKDRHCVWNKLSEEWKPVHSQRHMVREEYLAAETGLTKINQYVVHALNMNCSVWVCRPWEFRLWKELIHILITLEVQLIIAQFKDEIDEYSVAEQKDFWPQLLAMVLIIFMHIALHLLVVISEGQRRNTQGCIFICETCWVCFVG